MAKIKQGVSRRRRRLLPLVGAGAVALAIGGCGGNTSTAAKPTTSSGQPATVGVATATKLGHVLVDSQGRTLYLFEANKGTRSTCNGACAVAWPPLRAGHMPVSGSGVDAAKVGMTARSGGGRQITYNGHPLYRFGGDHRAGDTNGQEVTAFGASWFAVSPDGNATSGSTSSSGGYGGY
jgi:predicted lipoprotein with Yx(FWY)xxD motif